MSVATISYSSLRDASSEANAVSKKLDRYADNLHSSVLESWKVIPVVILAIYRAQKIM